jgi:lysophospholipase L1-like esterase
MSRVDLSTEVIFSIDFNLHWVPAALGLEVSPAAAATMLGITETEFLAYATEAETQVKRTAEAMLDRPELQQAIDHLAIPAGGRVMAVGDSITTYRYGYARLLATMIALRRPDEKIHVINVAQSGYTSTHGLESTYTQFLAHQPDWVFIKFGVNDCKQFGGPEAKPLVSLEEYRANIAGIVQAFLNYTPARPVLLTPTPVVESIVTENPDFQDMRMTWSNTELQARADAVRDLAARHQVPFVNLMALFGPSPDPDLYVVDGLHPGPAGQQLILEAVLRTLSAQ